MAETAGSLAREPNLAISQNALEHDQSDHYQGYILVQEENLLRINLIPADIKAL